MFFYLILLVNILLINANQNLDLQFCSKEENSCDSSAKDLISSNEEKYIFYDVNPPEGFNLRRDVYMRFAVMLAEAQKDDKKRHWRLVLPPWYRLFHWRSQTSNTKPIPWNAYFDINSLKSFAPVVELFEIFPKPTSKKSKFKIDVLYVLQNYEDPFEGGSFADKWEISKYMCEYDGKYWGYNNITAKEVICVRFQGKITMLWELIALHPYAKTVMFAHGEIPLHTSYGSKTFWDCRKSMKFNSKLQDEADKFLRNHLDCHSERCSTYISVHWRRQDFAVNRKRDIPSIIGTVVQINNFIQRNCPDINKIFIASDATQKELIALERQLSKLNYQVYNYMPSNTVLEKYKDGGVAIIEQIICSRAAYLIGTHESTFTFRIQEEREILGFDSNTSFNRLCPDSGKCAKMSRWTIVH